jgi:hypothetical protein
VLLCFLLLPFGLIGIGDGGASVLVTGILLLVVEVLVFGAIVVAFVYAWREKQKPSRDDYVGWM